MRATISRCLHALKQRRSSDEGFSLIELIVVVAILGILVAIAIPVFGNIQETARINALEAAAANGATAVAAAVADNDTTTDATGAITKINTGGDITLSLAAKPAAAAAPTTVDQVCVVASPSAAWASTNVKKVAAGPGCTADSTT